MEGFENVYRETLDPTTGLSLSLVLLRGVNNCHILKEQVMSGALQCSIMKPVLIADPFQVVVAANKAALSYLAGNMVTKSIYTELLFNLSISKNISQSLMKFGIHESDEDILVATIDKGDELKISQVISLVDGNIAPLAELQSLCNTKVICKSYKINDTEMKTGCLLDSVVSRIATSDFVSH